MREFANHRSKSLQRCFRVQRGLTGFGSPRRLALRLNLGGMRNYLLSKPAAYSTGIASKCAISDAEMSGRSLRNSSTV